jgi:hypothetical protein
MAEEVTEKKHKNGFLVFLKATGISLAVLWSLAFIASVCIAIIVYIKAKKLIDSLSSFDMS